MLNFEHNLIVPLLGVALGWLLSEAAHVMRGRRERKKVYGKVVLRLLEIREMLKEELRRLAIAKEFSKSGQGLTSENRRFLRRNVSPFRVNESLHDADELLLEIAAVDPFLAFDLEMDLAPLVNLVPNAGGYTIEWKLDQRTQKFWDESLIFAEGVAFNVFTNTLKTAVLKLSRRKGLFALTKAWWYFKMEDKRESNHPHEDMAKMTVELRTTLAPIDSVETPRAANGFAEEPPPQ